MNYLMMILYTYIIHCTLHLQKKNVQLHFRYVDRLFRQVCNKTSCLDGVSIEMTINLRKAYKIIAYYYGKIVYIVFRLACHMIIGYSILQGLLYNYCWLQTLCASIFGLCYYSSFVWLCFFYSLSCVMFNFFCLYFRMRLIRLNHRLHQMRLHSTRSASNRSFSFDSDQNNLYGRTHYNIHTTNSRPVSAFIQAFTRCYQQFRSVDEITKVKPEIHIKSFNLFD